jgi:hypothetical protein
LLAYVILQVVDLPASLGPKETVPEQEVYQRAEEIKAQIALHGELQVWVLARVPQLFCFGSFVPQAAAWKEDHAAVWHSQNIAYQAVCMALAAGASSHCITQGNTVYGPSRKRL